MNFIATFDDPTYFIFDDAIYEFILKKKKLAFDYDNPRYENLRVELDKLLSLTDEFKIVHAQNDLMKCEIIHADIINETYGPATKLVESEIEKTKVEFKSTLDCLSEKIKSSLDKVDPADSKSMLSYLNQIDLYYPALVKDEQFMYYIYLKHEIKQWLEPRYDSLDENFRNDCNDLWQTIHHYEGIWDHVINLCRAIMEFGVLIEIHYD